MKKIAKSILVVLLMTGAVFSVFANGGKEAEAAAPAAEGVEQVMVAALDNGPGGNNGDKGVPYSVGAGHTLIAKMYTPLTIFDEKQESVVPYAAKSWESNADFTVWTFNLADGLTWSDGKAVTASDVKFTAEFCTDPGYVTAVAADRNLVWGNVAGFQDKIDGKISELSSVEAVNDSTVRITLGSPDPRYFAKVFRAYILPEHALTIDPSENMDSDWWITAGQQVGSGPFFVSGYQQDESLELSANPHYFMGAPKLDKIIVKFFSSEEASATLALAAGDLDFSYINYGDIATLGNKVNVYEGMSSVPRFFDFNFKNLGPQWDDVRVRQAIYHAIDRETITKTIYQTTHTPINAFILSEAAFPASMNQYEYNPEKAKSLLAEAGVDPADLTMDVIGYKGDPMTLSAMQAVQNYLSQIGISFTHTALDVPSYRASYSADGDWGIVYRGTGGMPWTVDPTMMFSNGGAQGGDFRGYDYSDMDATIASLGAADTNEAFFDTLGAINAMVNENATQVWLWAGKAYGASLKRVKNFHWYPANGGGPYMDNAHLWELAD